MAYKLAIFDLDGTILDTLDDLTASVNFALATAGFPLRSRDEVRSFVGNGIKMLISRSLSAGCDEARAEQVFAAFSAHYRQHSADRSRPYSGITELLGKLRSQGLRTAVVSNKADFAVQALCRHFFADLFDLTVGEQPGLRVKPHPDLIQAIWRQLPVPPEETIYIGDSEVDIATASRSGLACISVTWGFRDKEFLLSQGATQLAESPQELEALLLHR